MVKRYSIIIMLSAIVFTQPSCGVLFPEGACEVEYDYNGIPNEYVCRNKNERDCGYSSNDMTNPKWHDNKTCSGIGYNTNAISGNGFIYNEDRNASPDGFFASSGGSSGGFDYHLTCEGSGLCAMYSFTTESEKNSYASECTAVDSGTCPSNILTGCRMISATNTINLYGYSGVTNQAEADAGCIKNGGEVINYVGFN